MDLKQIIAILKKEDATPEELAKAAEALEQHKTDHEKLRGDASKLGAIEETLGDRDLGELIGFVDAVKAALASRVPLAVKVPPNVPVLALIFPEELK